MTKPEQQRLAEVLKKAFTDKGLHIDTLTQGMSEHFHKADTGTGLFNLANKGDGRIQAAEAIRMMESIKGEKLTREQKDEIRNSIPKEGFDIEGGVKKFNEKFKEKDLNRDGIISPKELINQTVKSKENFVLC